jgi:hypothetical protein
VIGLASCEFGRGRVGVAGMRRSATLMVFGLLGGTLMFPIISYLSTQSAAADANAVVSDGAFSGFTPVAFGPNDDGTYPCTSEDAGTPPDCTPTTVPLGFNINFYGTEFSGAYINNNGNLTFDAPLSQFTPTALTTFGSPIIAPFFADVDTRAGNTVNYGTATFNGHDAFVVNWPGVGCFSENDTVLDDFQAILIDRPDLGTGPLGDDFQIEFNFDSIQWDAGEDSGGGTPSCTGAPDDESAVVGFSNGTSTSGDSFQLAGSQSSGAFLDSNGSTGLINNDLNSNVLGRYIFEVHNGQPIAPTSIVTSLSADGQSGTNLNAPFGTAVTDTATLSGTNASTATGTVTYDVYSDSGCTTFAPGGEGTAEPITTPGTLPDSSPYTVTAASTYYWQASYSAGDDPLNESSMSTCGSEQVTAFDPLGPPPPTPPPSPPPPPTLTLPTAPKPPPVTPPPPATPKPPATPAPLTPSPFTPTLTLPPGSTSTPTPVNPAPVVPLFPQITVTPPPPTPVPTPITAQTANLTLSSPAIIPGGNTTASGTGCVANSPVVLSILGHTVATTTADQAGDFSAPITPPPPGVGHLTVVATCGAVQLTAFLDVVASVKAANPEGGAAVFCVFVLIGAVLLRGQFSTSGRRKRRRRGAADVLGTSA